MASLGCLKNDRVYMKDHVVKVLGEGCSALRRCYLKMIDTCKIIPVID